MDDFEIGVINSGVLFGEYQRSKSVDGSNGDLNSGQDGGNDDLTSYLRPQ